VLCDFTDIRLVDGNSNSSGRVELLYNGVWGPICGPNFSIEESVVICRMLGYYSGEKGFVTRYGIAVTGFPIHQFINISAYPFRKINFLA